MVPVETIRCQQQCQGSRPQRPTLTRSQMIKQRQGLLTLLFIISSHSIAHVPTIIAVIVSVEQVNWGSGGVEAA